MPINTETNVVADLSIAPTDQGMVRVFVETSQMEIPMDFSPDEAEEIAAEIMVASAAARSR